MLASPTLFQAQTISYTSPSPAAPAWRAGSLDPCSTQEAEKVGPAVQSSQKGCQRCFEYKVRKAPTIPIIKMPLGKTGCLQGLELAEASRVSAVRLDLESL